MADTKTSDLASNGTPSPSDLLMTVDVSDTSMSADGTNKKALVSAVLDLAFPIDLTADVTGVLPVANFATGTPNGSKFVRDDGVLAVPSGGSGDVVGPASSVDKEIALFDATTGKLLERATGSGIVRVTSGVYGTPGPVNLTSEVTGVLPVTNFTTGTPTGSKFVRDDGVLAVPGGGGFTADLLHWYRPVELVPSVTASAGNYTTGIRFIPHRALKISAVKFILGAAANGKNVKVTLWTDAGVSITTVTVTGATTGLNTATFGAEQTLAIETAYKISTYVTDGSFYNPTSGVAATDRGVLQYTNFNLYDAGDTFPTSNAATEVYVMQPVISEIL